MYDYTEQMKDDIREYIENNIDLNDFMDDDELREYLKDTLWNEDSVTGNGSGSYTFSRHTAKEYVIDNMNLLKEAIMEFDISYIDVSEKFLSEDWEYFDCTIRCYLLSYVIDGVVDEYYRSELYEENKDEIEMDNIDIWGKGGLYDYD